MKTIEEILQPAGDLITQRYYYTDMDTFESYKELLGAKIPLTTDKVVFTYKGAISAGIVLSKVEFEVNERPSTLRFPTSSSFRMRFSRMNSRRTRLRIPSSPRPNSPIMRCFSAA